MQRFSLLTFLFFGFSRLRRAPLRQRILFRPAFCIRLFFYQLYLLLRVLRYFIRRFCFALHYCFFLPLRSVFCSTLHHVSQGFGVRVYLCMTLGSVGLVGGTWGTGKNKTACLRSWNHGCFYNRGWIILEQTGLRRRWSVYGVYDNEWGNEQDDGVVETGHSGMQKVTGMSMLTCSFRWPRTLQ